MSLCYVCLCVIVLCCVCVCVCICFCMCMCVCICVYVYMCIRVVFYLKILSRRFFDRKWPVAIPGYMFLGNMLAALGFLIGACGGFEDVW